MSKLFSSRRELLRRDLLRTGALSLATLPLLRLEAAEKTSQRPAPTAVEIPARSPTASLRPSAVPADSPAPQIIEARPIVLPEADPLASFDATTQADLVRRGEVSVVELVEAAIRRIEQLNPHLPAVVSDRFAAALAEARRLPAGTGPLRGVPTLLQDVAIAGEAYPLGSRLLALVPQPADADDALYERLRHAGMIMLGRTSMPELVDAPVTRSRLWGAARNPWDLARTPGGGSGGAAAAVASLMVPVAQGSDSHGGLRLPAAATGLVGLKPSRGRISAAPHSEAWVDVTACRGWLTRSVRDSAALLDICAGTVRGDSIAAPRALGTYRALLSRSTGKLRIGIWQRVPGDLTPIDPEVTIALRVTAQLLHDLGHRVEEAAPRPWQTTDHFEIMADYAPLQVSLRLAQAERQLGRELTAAELEPAVYALYRRARETPAIEFARTLQRIHDYSRTTLAWWNDGFDMLVTPAIGRPAPLLDELTGTLAEGMRRERVQWMGFMGPASLTGQPAISLPVYWTPGRLPLGVQIVADMWREDLLLQLAAEIEKMHPWSQQLPPVHA